eukprot:GHVL01010165.1.p1 GENE.GHVL01010165.1~~GHVL01010165.1.p1  ORF type:complete len:446 (+),score=86.45 GHVL01010165.1:1239-2576(+)
MENDLNRILKITCYDEIISELASAMCKQLTCYRIRVIEFLESAWNHSFHQTALCCIYAELIGTGESLDPNILHKIAQKCNSLSNKACNDLARSHAIRGICLLQNYCHDVEKLLDIEPKWSDISLDTLLEGLDDPYWKCRFFALEGLKVMFEKSICVPIGVSNHINASKLLPNLFNYSCISSLNLLLSLIKVTTKQIRIYELNKEYNINENNIDIPHEWEGPLYKDSPKLDDCPLADHVSITLELLFIPILLLIRNDEINQVAIQVLLSGCPLLNWRFQQQNNEENINIKKAILLLTTKYDEIIHEGYVFEDFFMELFTVIQFPHNFAMNLQLCSMFFPVNCFPDEIKNLPNLLKAYLPSDNMWFDVIGKSFDISICETAIITAVTLIHFATQCSSDSALKTTLTATCQAIINIVSMDGLAESIRSVAACSLGRLSRLSLVSNSYD